jgi:hypothetical protein
MPTGEIDQTQPCHCGEHAPMRQAHPEHTIAEHTLYEEGGLSGWQAARRELLDALPDQSDRITAVLG